MKWDGVNIACTVGVVLCLAWIYWLVQDWQPLIWVEWVQPKR